MQDRQLEQLHRYNKALELLKNKNYSEAEKTTMMDYPFQPVVGNRTEQDDKEVDYAHR
ncbi:hypothetical protein [Paenibacillus polymyxa]|uniref:hypothetical protein n=1 Tax=Paenibacillus polymyxa TaxID=1406 RepID=UPI002ECFE0D1